MFAVPLTSTKWSQGLRTEIPGNPEEEGDSADAAVRAGQTPEADGGVARLKVTLRMRVPDKPGLVAVERDIAYVRGVAAQIQAAVSELSVTSEGAPALLPEGTRVVDVAFSKAGIVYVDFSPELEAGRGVGTEEERLLILGIVRTITDNFAAVRRVVILVDGRAPKEGHLDLSRPLRRDDPSFAEDLEPEPDASPGAGAVKPKEGNAARAIVIPTHTPKP